MDIFEFLRTSFRLLVAFLSLDVLIYIGLGILVLLILWTVIALLCSFENKFAHTCIRIMRFLKDNSLSVENYPEFTKMFYKFPLVLRRNWKKFEIKQDGLPSDYIKQSECLDGILEGGFNKQSRSLMKSVINFSVFVLALGSLSIIGTAQAEGNIIASINTKVLTEALIIPFIFFLLYKVVYYVYTSSRHHQYKVAVDTFNDFLDVLDERVDVSSIFFGGEQSIALVSNVYENDSMQMLREKQKLVLTKTRNKKLSIIKDSFESKGLNPPIKDILTRNTNNSKEKQLNNVIVDDTVKSMIDMTATKTVKKTKLQDSEIKNETDFVKVMEKTEKLIEQSRKETDNNKRKDIDKQINKLVSEMTVYKNKAKKRK